MTNGEKLFVGLMFVVIVIGAVLFGMYLIKDKTEDAYNNTTQDLSTNIIDDYVPQSDSEKKNN